MLKEYEGDPVYKLSIGESSEGRSIDAFVFMLGTDAENFETELKARQSILIDAAHHARELTTISQVAFTMMNILNGYENGREDYKEMLENSALIFIPLVNPDGVQYIETTWKNTQKFEYIRKNRNIYDGMQ